MGSRKFSVATRVRFLDFPLTIRSRLFSREKAKDPYRVAIMHIMMDLTDDLLYQFADSLPTLQDSVDPTLYPPLIRFFAHLVLYLRLVGKTPPAKPARDILQAFLDVLEREGKGELVAVYAGSLGERRGEESYARFLRGKLWLPRPSPQSQGSSSDPLVPLQTWIPIRARENAGSHSSEQRSTASISSRSLS